MKFYLTVIYIIFFALISVNAQVKRPVIIEAKVHSGLILPFYDAIAYLIEEDIAAFDINCSFPTYGEDYWEKMYRYPRAGFGYSFWNLGNDEVFGKAHALYGFVNIPFFKPKGKFSLNYEISFGASYLTKSFDPHENHLNRAISSHYNVYIHTGIDGKIKIKQRYEIVLGAGVTHFSNGKTHSPNYGINAGTVFLGLNYLIGNLPGDFKNPDPPFLSKRFSHTVIYAAGGKVYDNLMGKKYFISSLNYNFNYLLNHRRKIGMGADFFYDGSIREGLAEENNYPEEDVTKLIRFGLHASHSVQYKNFVMGIQIGHYLYSKYTDLSLIYNRIAFQYFITNHLLLNISVKSHMAKADYIEWGIGYNW